MYNIDWIKLLLWNVPELLQLPKLTGLVKAFISPIQMIYADFLVRRDRDKYKIAHNGQVCYLEAALNDSFDNTLRRIYIGDGYRYPRIYLYTHSENRPKYIYEASENKPLYIHTRNDYGDTSVDFNVYVPSDLKGVINEYALKALINYYKLASKRYQIIYG